jgi:hypothetical protein
VAAHVQQRFGLFQIARVEPFGEPAINRSEQFASLLCLPLVAPEPRHAHYCAQLPGLCLLLSRNRERPLEIRFHFYRVRLRPHRRDFSSDAMDLRPAHVPGILAASP